MPEELGCRIKAAGAAGGAALAILAGNSRALWPHFVTACARDPSLLGHTNPLYAYIHAAVESALTACCGGAARPRVYWSHLPANDLEGGGKFVAMQRMAACAGLAFLDHAAHLSLHPVYGPWISLRCVILFDDLEYDVGPQPQPLPNPLDERAQLAVSAAMVAALHSSGLGTQGGEVEDAGEAKPSMAAVRESWQNWVVVRDAPYPDHPFRYYDDQIRYHYTSQRQVLEEAVLEHRRSLQGPS